MTKTKPDLGRRAYETEIAERPNYTASGKPRPQWEDLPEGAQNAWRKRFNAGE